MIWWAIVLAPLYVARALLWLFVPGTLGRRMYRDRFWCSMHMHRFGWSGWCRDCGVLWSSRWDPLPHPSPREDER